MSRYRCCCCSVTVGSRVFAAFTAVCAFCALISDVWSVSTWYYWAFNSIMLILELFAGIMVFVAIKRRSSKMMIPILAMTIINIIEALVFLGFTISAIFTDDSPFAQAMIEEYKTLQWFRQMLYNAGISLDEWITAFSITMSVTIVFSLFIGIWIFITHYSTYTLLKTRLLHPLHNIPPEHIVPTTYPPPTAYPTPMASPVATMQQQQPMELQHMYQMHPQQSEPPPAYSPSAAPVESLTYPGLTAYAFDPNAGKVEQ
ncbi:hypothetical protein PMAYCL1PPCAC_19129, partial [Pristionchus mayeri]